MFWLLIGAIVIGVLLFTHPAGKKLGKRSKSSSDKFSLVLFLLGILGVWFIAQMLASGALH